MDNRRLSTADVLAFGIIDLPAPETDIPADRERFDADVEALTSESLLTALAAGQVLYCPEYYGCVYGWLDESGYHGVLLQYRNVTERPTFQTAEELTTWFIDTATSVAG